MQYSTAPGSAITAETVTVSGVALSQKDTAGITTTATRSYTANGMVLTQTDGRWIGRDKLGIKAGLNQYWYVANITCHSSDYLGLSNYAATPGPSFTPSPDKGSGAINH